MEILANAVINIWRVINDNSSIAKLLEAVVKAAESISGAEFAEFHLAGYFWSHLEYKFAAKEEISLLMSLRTKQSANVIGIVTKDQTILEIFSGSEWPLEGKCHRKKTAVTNFLSFPLHVEGQKLGLLQLFNHPQGFTDSTNDFLAEFLLQIENAIEKELMRVRLTRMEARLNSIFETIADGILVINKHAVPQLKNRAFDDMFFPNSVENVALEAILPSMFGSMEAKGTQEIVLLKPHAKILSSNYVMSFDDSGNVEEIVMSLRDITSQKQSEQRFLQFITLITRRLRCMLKAIQNPKLKQSRRHRLRRHLRSTIQSLSYLTELKAGPLRVAREGIVMREFFPEILDRAKTAFAIRDMKISTTLSEDDLNFPLQADPKFLGQGLGLLLKFHASHMKRSAKLLITSIRSDNKLTLRFGSSSEDWKTLPEAVLLDWHACIALTIAEKNNTFELNLAFVKHILEAHKARISIQHDMDRLALEVSLPRGLST